MLKRVLISSLLVAPLAITVPMTNAVAQNDGKTTIITNDADQNTSALITRQQERMGLLETDLRNLRGIVEQDLRQLKMQIGQLSSSASNDETEISADIRAITSQLERLTDSIAMTNRRMERTLEITSDVEFRVLRMEKRMQTLITLGGDDVASAAIQQDTIAGGVPEEVQMSRNRNDGSVTWTMNEDELNEQLGVNAEVASGDNVTGAADAVTQDSDGSLAKTDAATNTAATNTATTNTAATNTANTGDVAQDSQPEVVAATPQVLPDVSPEEQYRFALGRALQNDLETAERAFDEFRKFNRGHQREADASFWLGRVQFMRGQYEKSAMTFSEFNSIYPDDARLVDTTMWIAESVSHFAPQEQACAIYASLPQLLDSPPESFYTRLDALSKAANCDG